MPLRRFPNSYHAICGFQISYFILPFFVHPWTNHLRQVFILFIHACFALLKLAHGVRGVSKTEPQFENESVASAWGCSRVVVTLFLIIFYSLLNAVFVESFVFARSTITIASLSTSFSMFFLLFISPPLKTHQSIGSANNLLFTDW